MWPVKLKQILACGEEAIVAILVEILSLRQQEGATATDSAANLFTRPDNPLDSPTPYAGS